MKLPSNPPSFVTPLLMGLLLFVVPEARGAEPPKGPGPISLLLTYKCRPENRPAFRAHLQGEGLVQIATWQKGGSFKEHLLLFGFDVNEDAWDALLALRFDDWSQYSRWKETERTFPAALSSSGLKLTSSVSSALSELAWQGTAPEAKRGKQKPVYFVRPYFFQNEGMYRQFFDAYNSPQLEAWARIGAVNSYRVFVNQNPTGDTWGVMFLYEYPSWEAANARDDVKNSVGPELRAIPGWELLGLLKGNVRTSGRVTLAERLGQ